MAAPRTGFRAEPIRIAEREIAPGVSERLELPVGRLPTGTMLALELQVLHGERAGPRLFVCAALHGDELNGIPIIQEVLDVLEPKKLAGTVIAAPVVNLFGLANESRYLPDRRDLNRAFPGSSKGSMAARLARLFLGVVVEGSDVGIDLHTGSDGRANWPQIRCDLSDPETERLARAFAAPVVLDGKPPRGSLRRAAVESGVRVLNYEAGEAHRFDRHAIRCGRAGVLRVLRELGMVEEAPEADAEPLVCREAHWVRARRSGFCRLAVDLGDRVPPGGRIATLGDLFERRVATVRSERGGVVIGCTRKAQVYRGEALAHLARVEGRADSGGE